MFSDGLPRNDNKFVMGGSRHGKLDSIDFGTDQHRAMVCDMQKTIEAAVNKRIADNGDTKQNEIFWDRTTFPPFPQNRAKLFPNTVIFPTQRKGSNQMVGFSDTPSSLTSFSRGDGEEINY